MAIFHMLVGLPASGKSTYAKELQNENTIILSSDNLREELYGDINNQEHNSELFQEMNKRTKEYLLKGYNVIYDATNINSKRRMSLLKELNKTKCKKVCIYFAIDVKDCILNDCYRDRQVGTEVIDKMYINMQVPMYHEGWDDIIIKTPEVTKISYFRPIFDIKNYRDYLNLISDKLTKACINLSQDNPHHTLSVSRHMYFAYDWIKDYCDNELLLIATLLHDIGKPYCKLFKKDSRYASFYGHENVSAQLSILFLLKSNLSPEEIIKVATYIQLHMRLMNLNDNVSAKEKFCKLVGNELFDELSLLRNADYQAK